MPEVQLEDILHANPEAHILGVNAVSHLGDLLSTIEQRKKTGIPGGERLKASAFFFIFFFYSILIFYSFSFVI